MVVLKHQFQKKNLTVADEFTDDSFIVNTDDNISIADSLTSEDEAEFTSSDLETDDLSSDLETNDMTDYKNDYSSDED